MKHYCIIGAGAAGISAIEGIRKIDKKSKISLISDEKIFPYSRVLLNFFVEGIIKKEDELFIKNKDFFKEQNVDLYIGKRVEGVDFKKCKVFLESGEKIDYDSLLISTGASAKKIDIPGADDPYVMVFRTIEDANKILKNLKDIKEVVIIGGGPVGVKVALSMANIGIKVNIVEVKDRLLFNQVDQCVAKKIESLFKNKGIKVFTQTSVSEIQRLNKQDLKVITSSGSSILCQLVIMCIGVEPNVSFLRNSGMDVEDGIKLDNNLRTNVENVFGAGDVGVCYDVVEEKFMLHPIWPVAVEQGMIAGMNMAGANINYNGTVMFNSFQIEDLSIITAGMSNPKQGCEVYLFEDKNRNLYRKIVMRDDYVVGMIWLNQVERAGVVVNLIRQKKCINFSPEELMIKN